jgi:hypothetical protein
MAGSAAAIAGRLVVNDVGRRKKGLAAALDARRPG